MKRRSDTEQSNWDELRQRVIGLGESSAQKSYYPELVTKMAELERFRTLLDEVSDVILVVSASDGIIADANEAAARLFAITKADLRGRDARKLLEGELHESTDDVLAPLRPRRVVEATFGPDRTVFEVALRHVDFDGREYVVVIGRDITERKRTEQLLEDHRKHLEFEVERRTAALSETVAQLRDAADVRNRFLAKMSHELRTPLNSVIGFSGVLLQGHAGKMSEEADRQLGMINASGRHLLKLINDILNYSRIERGDIEIECERVDSGPLIRRCVSMLELEARKRELVLTERISPDMPLLNTDPGKLTQILTNLVENGLKYTDAGGVSVHADPDGEGGVVVKVIDTGIGIAPESVDLIWHEFRQLQRPAGAVSEGTGLGLAISKRLADAIGAELTVESQLGVGSTFTFRVPNLGEDCVVSGGSAE